MTGKNIIYNVMALLTVFVWGITFVSTKVLIANGLNPVEIFIIRFSIAYACTLVLSHERLWASDLKDEFFMLAAGVTGGSLYFIAENTALGMTFASNVSLIICCAPLITMMLGKLFFDDEMGLLAWIGSVIAFIGVGIVAFGSSATYGVNPSGDLLTLVAALSWAVYCLLLKNLNSRYSNLFITRKVFAYGVLTAVIYYMLTGSVPRIVLTGAVVGNLLFLSVGASFICYLMWNSSVKYLGPEKTSSYIYLVPLVTILASSLILGEPVTFATAMGTILILGGIFISAIRSHGRKS